MHHLGEHEKIPQSGNMQMQIQHPICCKELNVELWTNSLPPRDRVKCGSGAKRGVWFLSLKEACKLNLRLLISSIFPPADSLPSPILRWIFFQPSLAMVKNLSVTLLSKAWDGQLIIFYLSWTPDHVQKFVSLLISEYARSKYCRERASIIYAH